jgi:hypothetical protein
VPGPVIHRVILQRRTSQTAPVPVRLGGHPIVTPDSTSLYSALASITVEVVFSVTSSWVIRYVPTDHQ